MNGLLFPLNVAHDLGLTLVHFLWQGLLLAALLHTVLPLCRSAITRHNCALLTLVLMALAPVATFLSLHSANAGAMTLAHNVAPMTLFSAPNAASHMDWLVLLWLGGVMALSIRAIGGWTLANALARQGTISPSPALLQRCHNLQHRLSVTAPVRFLLSYRITAPVVIGLVKPVILIPVSALMGLSPQQLDALILHELAHIRRRDTVINILLATVETILFYHPAVWWVSRQVRVERENCCDDHAVSACGDVGLYVEALTSLENQKAYGLALAANGGSLKSRVARLLDVPVQSSRFSLSGVTGLALLGLVAASVAIAAPSPQKVTAIKPIMETHTLPPYPAESLHAHEEGRVLLAVTIGADGGVSKASVFKPSGHPRLDDAAEQYVKGHWRWQPATRAGKPVATNTRVSVLFKLKEPAKPAKR
jgi:bla regulator protein BlaR1